MPGTPMALGRGGLPHDLVQMVVEGTLHIDDGFWGSVAAGATFRSTGRKRTRPGRAVIAANRKGIAAAEGIVGRHYSCWQRGEPTPTAAVFDGVARLWADLGDGGALTLEWPGLRVVSSTGPVVSGTGSGVPETGAASGTGPGSPGTSRYGTSRTRPKERRLSM